MIGLSIFVILFVALIVYVSKRFIKQVNNNTYLETEEKIAEEIEKEELLQYNFTPEEIAPETQPTIIPAPPIEEKPIEQPVIKKKKKKNKPKPKPKAQ
jgi:hypothetical protein